MYYVLNSNWKGAETCFGLLYPLNTYASSYSILHTFMLETTGSFIIIFISPILSNVCCTMQWFLFCNYLITLHSKLFILLSFYLFYKHDPSQGLCSCFSITLVSAQILSVAPLISPTYFYFPSPYIFLCNA